MQRKILNPWGSELLLAIREEIGPKNKRIAADLNYLSRRRQTLVAF